MRREIKRAGDGKDPDRQKRVRDGQGTLRMCDAKVRW